jgi:hypothetical protein
VSTLADAPVKERRRHIAVLTDEEHVSGARIRSEPEQDSSQLLASLTNAFVAFRSA